MAHLLNEISNYNESPSRSGTNTPNPVSQSRAREPTAPNVFEVILGNFWIKPEYPSFYPVELVGGTLVDRLYVCQWCFKYARNAEDGFLRHIEVCEYRDPTTAFGKPCYRSKDYSIYEIDGGTRTLFAQSLSLFAKLFLDTKSVFYDVSTFLYYLLVYHHSSPPGAPPSPGPHSFVQHQKQAPQIVGFFSKEKLSWDANNLACILIFPPWQKKGLGQVLMSLSYALGREEDRQGGPEKPLSNMGQAAYTAFWAGCIARWILERKAGESMTVREIGEGTGIAKEDVAATLREMGVLERRKMGTGKSGSGKWIKGSPGKKGQESEESVQAVITKGAVRAWMNKHRVAKKDPIDKDQIDFEAVTLAEGSTDEDESSEQDESDEEEEEEEEMDRSE